MASSESRTLALMRRGTIALAAALIVCMSSSCRDSTTRSDADGATDAGSSGPATPPQRFCTVLPPTRVAATVTPVYSPDNDRDGVIVDELAILGRDRIYVLDVRARKVVGLAADGRELVRWGRDGKGPGEFEDPRAIAASPAGEIYVLDARHVDVFSPAGGFLRSVRLPFAARSLALTPIGELAIADWVVARNAQPRPYVAVFHERSQAYRNLLMYNERLLGHRPFIAPANNRVTVTTAADGRLAAWYHYDPTVVIFRGGQRAHTITGCLDPAVYAAYQRQVREWRRQRQLVFSQIAGVWLSPAGETYVATANGFDKKGFISRYDSTGKPVAVYEFAYPDDTSLGFHVAFWNAPDVLVAFDARGINIWRLSLPAQ
jgi:hypothetical protein